MDLHPTAPCEPELFGVQLTISGDLLEDGQCLRPLVQAFVDEGKRKGERVGRRKTCDGVGTFQVLDIAIFLMRRRGAPFDLGPRVCDLRQSQHAHSAHVLLIGSDVFLNMCFQLRLYLELVDIPQNIEQGIDVLIMPEAHEISRKKGFPDSVIESLLRVAVEDA